MTKIIHRKEREAQLRRERVWRILKTVSKWFAELVALIFCVVTPFVLLACSDALGGMVTLMLFSIWVLGVFCVITGFSEGDL